MARYEHLPLYIRRRSLDTAAYSGCTGMIGDDGGATLLDVNAPLLGRLVLCWADR
jgi:hypothetical protein